MRVNLTPAPVTGRALLIFLALSTPTVFAQPSQSLQDPASVERMDVQEVVREHRFAQQRTVGRDTWAMVRRLAADVSDAWMSAFQPEDRRVLSALVGLDRRRIEREATEPHLARLCSQSSDLDIAQVGELLNVIQHSGPTAFDQTIHEHLARLTPDALLRIEEARNSRRTLTLSSSATDWAGVTRDLPEVVARRIVGDICERYRGYRERLLANADRDDYKISLRSGDPDRRTYNVIVTPVLLARVTGILTSQVAARILRSPCFIGRLTWLGKRFGSLHWRSPHSALLMRRP